MAYGIGGSVWRGTSLGSDWDQRQRALLPYQEATNAAQRQAIGTATTLGRANPFAGMRAATAAASQATGQVMGQRAAAEAQIIRQQQAEAEMRRREQEERNRQMLGNALGGAAGIVGTLVPAFGAANGIAGGIMGGGQGGAGGAVGALGRAIVGGGQTGAPGSGPQPPAHLFTPPPPRTRGIETGPAPIGGGMDAVRGGPAPIGGGTPPQAMQAMAPMPTPARVPTTGPLRRPDDPYMMGYA